MGTSVSHPSPKTLGWQAAGTCYRNEAIPFDRAITEVWRAAQKEDSPLVPDLLSKATFICQEAVRSSDNLSLAMKKATTEIFKMKGNSIVTEIARRSIPIAFQTSDKLSGWRSAFFWQVSDYLVSRDISGYVGKEYRNKTVGELSAFKQQIREGVKQTVTSIKDDPKSHKEWTAYSKTVLSKLSGR
jgi:hypothetical protein